MGFVSQNASTYKKNDKLNVSVSSYILYCHSASIRPLFLHNTDQNIGYGPTLDGAATKNPLVDTGYDDSFHPPPPPVTARKVTDDTTEVLKFDSNFIMTKPGENMAVRQVRIAQRRRQRTAIFIAEGVMELIMAHPFI